MSLAASEDDVETVNHLARQALRSSGVPLRRTLLLLQSCFLSSFFCSTHMFVANASMRMLAMKDARLMSLCLACQTACVFFKTGDMLVVRCYPACLGALLVCFCS